MGDKALTAPEKAHQSEGSPAVPEASSCAVLGLAPLQRTLSPLAATTSESTTGVKVSSAATGCVQEAALNEAQALLPETTTGVVPGAPLRPRLLGDRGLQRSALALWPHP
jgi:hypothetical protein